MTAFQAHTGWRTQLSVLDFETLYASPGWRTYLALQATFLSLAGRHQA
jgi:hypothetical protein